jgi:hypothetical protein
LKASIRAHGLAQSLRQTLRCGREDAHRRRQPPLPGALRTGGIRRHRRWRHRHRDNPGSSDHRIRGRRPDWSRGTITARRNGSAPLPPGRRSASRPPKSNHLSSWATDYLPANIKEFEDAASKWLRDNAWQLRYIGGDVGSFVADSDEAGHAFQTEAGHLFQFHAGRDSDLKRCPAHPRCERSRRRLIEPLRRPALFGRSRRPPLSQSERRSLYGRFKILPSGPSGCIEALGPAGQGVGYRSGSGDQDQMAAPGNVQPAGQRAA